MEDDDSMVDEHDLEGDPELMLAEIKALQSAWRAIEHVSETDEARRIIADIFPRRCASPTTVEDNAVCASMAKIIGEDAAPFRVARSVSEEKWEQHVLQTIACAWFDWSQGNVETARDVIPKLRAAQQSAQQTGQRKGAINLMTLYMWASAIEALINGDRKESQRLWKRALDLGSHFGTDSHPVVSWTYAASFFPTN